MIFFFCLLERVGNNMTRHTVSCRVIRTLYLHNQMKHLNTVCLCHTQSVLILIAGDTCN